MSGRSLSAPTDTYPPGKKGFRRRDLNVAQANAIHLAEIYFKPHPGGLKGHRSMTTANPPESSDTTKTSPPQWMERGGREVNEILKRRNHPVRRVLSFVRSYWIWGALAYIGIRAYVDTEFLNLLLVVLQFAFQLLFAVLFMIIQFGSIFWFMSRSKVEMIRPGDPKALTFDDYKGQDHLLKLVKQWISLLSDREQFQKMGGSFINGLMLYGPPGTGKTLLAKVMAGEAGVAFISMEGSGFRGMFWGMDVLKMIWFIGKARKMAREYGACIAYIDEIDAVGSSRGGVMGGAGGRTGGMGGGLGGMFGGGSGALTRLLYEMDGVGEKTRWERFLARLYKLFRKPPPPRNWHVLFMGSTNRPDVLDAALTRPGRFDRVIEVNRPDRKGRTEVVEYYLSKIQHDDTVDVEAIVADTSNYTPAQIMSAITKDAVRLALFDGRDKVSQRDIDMAFQEQAMGLENPIEEWDADQRRQVAYHEAGHAVAVYHLMPELRIIRTTIVRRAGALGYVHHTTTKEIHAAPLSLTVKRIMVSLAGDAATKILYGEPWTGTGGDYSSVRYWLFDLARSGYFGPPVADLAKPTDIINVYNDEMKAFWIESEKKTEQLLREHWDEVVVIADALLEKNDLSGEEVRALILGTNGTERVEDPEAELDEAIQLEVEGSPSPNDEETKESTEDAEPVEPEGQPASD